MPLLKPITTVKYLLTFFLVFSLCIGFTDLSYSQGKTKLTLNQIEKLIQIGTSDSIIATEIRSRGVDFIPNRSIFEKLRQIGAGSQTLAALRELMKGGKMRQITGEVIAIELDSKTITVKGKDKEVTISEVYNISDIKVGDKVVVKYVEYEGNENFAKAIRRK